MKKLVFIILLCFGLYLIVSRLDSYPVPEETWNETWSVEADAMVLLDGDTGKVLYGKNHTEAQPLASMTKLMTQYIVLNAISSGTLTWDSVYRPSSEAIQLGRFDSASKLGMQAGQTYTVRELFTGMTVISANDAALALAEMVAGTERQFVAMMNDQAQAFHLHKTKFYNPSGLDGVYLGRSEKETNLASAEDVAVLAKHLVDTHPIVLEFTSLQSMQSRQGMKMWNTNLLLPGMRLGMPGVDGLKTGYTDAAGPCFTGTGVFNGRRVYTVVMGAEEVDGDSSSPRFALTREMIGRFIH